MVAPLVIAGAGAGLRLAGSLINDGKDEGQARFDQLRQILQKYSRLPQLTGTDQGLMGQGQGLQSQALGLLGEGFSGDKEAALWRENAMRELGIQTTREQGRAAAGSARTGMGASSHARAVQGDIRKSGRDASRGIESDAALLGPQLAAAKQQMALNMLGAGQGTAGGLRNYQLNLMGARKQGLGMLSGVPITGKTGGFGQALSQMGGTGLGSALGSLGGGGGGEAAAAIPPIPVP